MSETALPTRLGRLGAGCGMVLIAMAVLLVSIVLAVSVGAVAIAPGTVWAIALDHILPGLVTPEEVEAKE